MVFYRLQTGSEKRKLYSTGGTFECLGVHRESTLCMAEADMAANWIAAEAPVKKTQLGTVSALIQKPLRSGQGP